jgi:hypothetical protein
VKPEETVRQEQTPGVLGRALDGIQQFVESDQKKLGGMHAGAMLRLGLSEIREVFSWPGGNIAQPTPYGMAGTLTPGEVYSARRDNDNAQHLEEGSTMDTNRLPSPAEIAAGKDVGARGQDHGQERLQGQEKGSVHGEQNLNPSPSQIADNPQPHAPEQQHGMEHDHGMER